MDASPTISLCMIVKDEEDWLATCLESVRPLVHEIIIVDTGSTDKTKEIAAAFGAKIFEEPWTDDFAAPRNISIAHAKGDWILILDADEAIDVFDHEKIRRLTKAKDVCYLLTQRHYSDDQRLSGFIPTRGQFPHWERHYGGYFESSCVRLFPNHRNIEYRGKVHELVEHSIAEKPEFRTIISGIRIHHYGHTREVTAKKKKSKLYTPLGESKTQDAPQDWKNFFELGVEHNVNGRREESIAAFMKSLELNPQYVPSWVNLGYVLCSHAKFPEAIQALETALQLNPQESEAYCNLGVVYMRLGEFKLAIAAFIQALKIKSDYVLVYCNLGECFVSLGRMGEGYQAFQKALEFLPNCASAKNGLGFICLSEGRVQEAEMHFRSAIEADSNIVGPLFYLGQILRLTDRVEEAVQVLSRFQQLQHVLLDTSASQAHPQ